MKAGIVGEGRRRPPVSYKYPDITASKNDDYWRGEEWGHKPGTSRGRHIMTSKWSAQTHLWIHINVLLFFVFLFDLEIVAGGREKEANLNDRVAFLGQSIILRDLLWTKGRGHHPTPYPQYVGRIPGQDISISGERTELKSSRMWLSWYLLVNTPLSIVPHKKAQIPISHIRLIINEL